jgi:response regulator RpfG family c-di-GMP phosphodiesterase
MRIARDVCDDRLELLIAAGIRMDTRIIERLVDLEVDDVYVEEPGTEDIVPEPELISDKTRRRTHKLLKRTFDEVMNIADMTEFANEDAITILQFDDRYANAVKVSSFHEVVQSTIEELFARREEMFEAPIVKTYLSRSYEHALNTAMLHDIGKLIFPDLANKPLRDLSPAESKRLRVHPAAGALIISRSAPLSNLEQAAIRQHHEQQDGRGYPLRLIGTNEPPLRVRVQGNREVFRFAEVLAVANTFDNLINGDLVVEAMSPARAMETLVRGAGSLYNRAVVSKALEIINVYPVGAIVEITAGTMLFGEGMRGVVRRASGKGLKRPEILVLWDRRGQRVTPRILDLNTQTGVEIELV